MVEMTIDANRFPMPSTTVPSILVRIINKVINMIIIWALCLLTLVVLPQMNLLVGTHVSK